MIGALNVLLPKGKPNMDQDKPASAEQALREAGQAVTGSPRRSNPLAGFFGDIPGRLSVFRYCGGLAALGPPSLAALGSLLLPGKSCLIVVWIIAMSLELI